MISWYENDRDRTWTCAPPSEEAIAFHRGLEGYAPTRLVDLPQLAAELGVGHVLAKDESSRLGLPAFKALGASWAVHRALRDRSDVGPVTVVTATDGNHGRAVARFSRLLGHHARIVVPRGVSGTAVEAIVGEGAEVTAVEGSYDDAVAAAARLADEIGGVLVQDTAWEGYEEIPGWIVEGYATLFAEADLQLDDLGLGRADLVVVPVGVGSLLQGALAHYRGSPDALGTAVMAVEPEAAACIAPSLAAGHPVSVETGTTAMAGLNCGTPSTLAWPFIEHGLDAAAAVSERADVVAAHDLAALGVAAGPCGAAGLAAARLALTGDGAQDRRTHLGVGPDSIVLLVVTEGSAANPVPALEEL
ncbi:MAG TPA: diaminopropionate ammonia-lyase [Candidatus Nanopelagicales bacterium]|nr:diaminopropionate ammonia-lyase [Candidatus Nanopelagicales bacterium]